MQRLTLSMDRFKKKPVSKANSAWELLAEEIAKKYGVAQKRFRWLFYKVPEEKIRLAFKEADTVEQLIKFSQTLNKKIWPNHTQ